MNIRASAHFVPGNVAAVQEAVTVKVITATSNAVEYIRDLAKERAQVKTGNLQSLIYSVVTVEGQVVTGSVVSPAPYSVYQEFGVGERGAASEWSGPYEYSSSRKGFPAVGYMRSSLDESQQNTLNCYRDQGFKV